MTGRRKEASMFPSPPVLSWLLHLKGICPRKCLTLNLSLEVSHSLSMEQRQTPKMERYSRSEDCRVEIVSPIADRPLNSRCPHLRPKVNFRIGM